MLEYSVHAAFTKPCRNKLNLPEPEILPGTDICLPYMVVADDAFPLTVIIIKPFSCCSMAQSEWVFN